MTGSFLVAVLPGDGIGAEVMREALKVFDAAARKWNIRFEIWEGLIGGAAMDRLGAPLPEETLRMCRKSHAILLGSIGGPKWDALPPEKRPEIGGLLALRKALNLYANIRPVVLFDCLKDISPLSPRQLQNNIDMVTVRELSGGIYFGQPRHLDNDEAFDTMRYNADTVERISRTAFELALGRRKKVTSVDKANVLFSSMLWRRVVSRVALEYPDVTLNHMYVDNAAMQMILYPGQFDVLLTENLFGDILSDESSALIGSLGMLPSASFGDSVHLYEPAGGSAPDIAGKNAANPIAQILSMAMMLEYSFKRPDAARAIRDAVERTLQKGIRTADIAVDKSQTVSTQEMGEAVMAEL